MVIATVAGGVFMTAVQTIAAKMEKEEYGVFFTLLRCLILLGIPAGGLQIVFAQQTAAALDEARQRQLSGTLRAVLRGTFYLWLLVAFVVVLRLDWILMMLKVTNPAAVVVTLFIVLTSLWLPVVRGLLQGRQDFLGMGWVAILDGAVRFATVVAIVFALQGRAAGAMVGALLGQIISLCLGLWLVRGICLGAGTLFAWKPWLRLVIPLTLGTGALLFLQTADVIYVQSIFPKDKSPFYMPGALIGFALVQFTVPLAAVMYPKIVRSAARAETSDALRLTLLTTAALGGVAAVAVTLLPELPLRILYFTKPELWRAATLVPWFAWCMLLFTLANVLVGNLLARERFAIVPWLVAVAAAYAFALAGMQGRLLALEHFAAFTLLVQVMTGFNLVLLGLAAWFTWGKSRSAPPI